MDDKGSSLTRDEKILWIMNALECNVREEYYAVLERLNTLDYGQLEVLDRISSSGPSNAESLREALLSQSEMKDILVACPLADKYDRHQNVMSVLEIVGKLRELGLTLENLDVHVRADIRCVFISHSGMTMRESAYVLNTGMVLLIDEFPDRMVEITDFRVKRKTNDAALMRESLSTAKPLSDGLL